uniref:CHCH domain-containing protein n=1 Tax=Oncorhynchus tshawytscha TaxID=74940 RepID=A0AAZ3R4K9_ONCTS
EFTTGGLQSRFNGNRMLNFKSHSKVSVYLYAMCITEMSMMMACWKQNNFADALCSNEMQSFLQIAVKAISEHHIIATTLLK